MRRSCAVAREVRRTDQDSALVLVGRGGDLRVEGRVELGAVQDAEEREACAPQELARVPACRPHTQVSGPHPWTQV